MTQENHWGELVARWREGSEDAARELYRALGPYILQVVRRLMCDEMRSKYDSADFTQAVWGSFFTQQHMAAAFPNRHVLLKYLVKMARYKVMTATRQRTQDEKWNVNREHSLEGSAAHLVGESKTPLPSPSQVVVAEETWERLLARVPEHLQSILVLLRQGKSQMEVAAELDIAPKTIQRLLHWLRRHRYSP